MRVSVVATRVGGLREILVDDVNGLSLGPPTGSDLALALTASRHARGTRQRCATAFEPTTCTPATEAMDVLWRRVIEIS